MVQPAAWNSREKDGGAGLRIAHRYFGVIPLNAGDPPLAFLHDIPEHLVELRRRPGRRHQCYGGQDPSYRKTRRHPESEYARSFPEFARRLQPAYLFHDSPARPRGDA